MSACTAICILVCENALICRRIALSTKESLGSQYTLLGGVTNRMTTMFSL